MHAKVLFTPIPLHKYRNPTRRKLLNCFDSIFNIRWFRVSNQIESFTLIFKVWMMVNEKDSIHMIQSDERLNSILIIDPKHGGFTSFCSNFEWITDYGTYQPHHLHQLHENMTSHVIENVSNLDLYSDIFVHFGHFVQFSNSDTKLLGNQIFPDFGFRVIESRLCSRIKLLISRI